jgi:hypothetical protein
MRRLALATCLTAAALPAAAAELTLHRVMLSAAGVGYFDYTAHADGAAAFGLDIPLDEVDDVLRSLAVFDDHGSIGSIELPSRDDSNRAFAGVPFAASALEDPVGLLNTLRGEEVTVTGPAAFTGRIVALQQEPLAHITAPGDPAPPASHTRVTLLTAEGFRQFILEDAASLQLTDPGLRARVAAALAAARQQTSASMRHLTLRTTGAGPRTISVGYVAVAPLWKASYRVVLPAAPGGKARVQGWAVLENQSGQDWKGVDLTLHTGNPVTFHQAIYASYYAQRPDVPVDVLSRILPDADQRIMVHAGARLFGERNTMSVPPPPPPAAPPPDMPPPPPEDFVPPPTIGQAAPALAAPAAPIAAAETVLDTIFHVPTPIDLAQGHTASVPILDQDMPAEQLDWLQPSSTRPITALRLTNSGAASLPPGALTLYSSDPATGTAFAGDARLSGLPAGETRLLGFAEDLRTTAARSTSPAPQILLHVSIAKGVMHRTLRNRITYTVDITAPVHDQRRVLVEFPRDPNAAFSLEGITTKPEATATAWRIAIDLKPGETRHIAADADTVLTTEDTLLQSGGDLDADALTAILATGQIDDATRARLQPLITLRSDVADKQAALTRLTTGQAAALADEDRIRNNLRVVTGPGDLHDKLLAALDADETELATLKTGIAQAQSALDAARASLLDAVEKLQI